MYSILGSRWLIYNNSRILNVMSEKKVKITWKKVNSKANQSAAPFAEEEQSIDEGEELYPLRKRRCMIALEDIKSKCERLKGEGNTLAESERFWEAIGKFKEAISLYSDQVQPYAERPIQPSSPIPLPDTATEPGSSTEPNQLSEAGSSDQLSEPGSSKLAASLSKQEKRRTQPQSYYGDFCNDNERLACSEVSILYELCSQCYAELSEIYPALRNAEIAVYYNPLCPIGHQTLGRAQLNIGELYMARSSFERALHFNPALEEGGKDLGLVCDLVNRLRFTEWTELPIYTRPGIVCDRREIKEKGGS